MYSDDKNRQRGYNEAVDTKIHGNTLDNGLFATQQTKQCSPSALQTMGNRLLDWFSVVMADTKRRRIHTRNKGIINTNTPLNYTTPFGT